MAAANLASRLSKPFPLVARDSSEDDGDSASRIHLKATSPLPLATLRHVKVPATALTQISGKKMTALTGMGYAHRAVEEGEEVVVTHRRPLT